MNRFSHVDLAAPPFPPPACGGGKGGTLLPVIAGARGAPPFPPDEGLAAAVPVPAGHSRRALRPPCPPRRGGQRVVALRGVFGHEGQGGSAAPEPVEATKARSSSLTSLG